MFHVTDSNKHLLLKTEGHHRLDDVVGPRELPGSLAGRHALPVLINEGDDVLQGDEGNISI